MLQFAMQTPYLPGTIFFVFRKGISMCLKWLEMVGRELLDDDPSGGGAPEGGDVGGGDTGDAGAEGGAGDAGGDAAPVSDPVSFEMPGEVMDAIYPGQAGQADPAGRTSDPGRAAAPQPAGDVPPAGSELPPMPTEEMLTTDPMRALEMLEARSDAKAEARFGQRLETLEKSTQESRTERDSIRQVQGAEFEARASDALVSVETTLKTTVFGENGVFAQSKEFRSMPKVRELAGQMVADQTGYARDLLRHPNPKARAEGLKRLNWIASDRGFAQDVLALAVSHGSRGAPASTGAVGYEGGFHTDGSPHSASHGSGLDPETVAAAKEQGITTEKIKAAQKQRNESWL